MKASGPSKHGWVAVRDEGLIAASRIVAVGLTEAAPIRRMIREMPPSHVVILTGGLKRKTAVLLDSGHVVITPLTLTELNDLLGDLP